MAKKKGKKKLTAQNADKHVLYQLSVQDPEVEIEFISSVFRHYRGRRPLSLREDFCGTAIFAGAWVESRKDRVAAGIDLHKPTLRWGIKNNLAKIGEPGKRLKLVNKNVIDIRKGNFDVAVAFNFSYFIFKQRAELKRYFEAVHKSLNDEGLFFLDAYGGSEAQIELEEPREVEGFDYIWDQDSFNPIDNSVVNYIHFHFPDGSKIMRAFKYEWRLWQLIEITELLREVGFSKAEVYWEGDDPDSDEGNGIFTRCKAAENSLGWIAYIVGVK